MGNCCATHSNELDNSLTYQRGGSSSGVKRVSDKSQHHSSLLTPKDQTNFQKKIIKSPPSPRSEGDILSSPHLKKFTLSDLKNATRNFRSDNLLGEGGFGDVYKGWMDEQTLVPARPGQGMPVAVKKLKADGLQGHKEWLSEVNYLGQLHHHNLVKLIGYCLEGENRLLVYEFMPKGSLENHLFKSGAQPLSWVIRIKVAIEAARGLSFLHDSDQQIIYRDFKASNILLDSDFNAKLSDFGLAKAGPTGDRTHVSTQVLGTQGYAAPEYIATGRLTAKCDVYSFGVVLLELLTGRRALDKTKVGLEQNLVDWAKPYLGDRRKLFRIMDTNLQGQYPQREAFMVALLASQCISEAKLRPRMAEVLAILEELPGTKYGTSPSLSDLNILSSPFSWSPLRYNAYSPYVSPRESPLPSPSPSQMNSPSNMDPRESPLLKRMKSSKGMDPKGSPMPTYVNLSRSMGST